MEAINTNKTKTKKEINTEKILGTLKKILIYTAATVGGIILLGILYQILEFLFVGAILLIAWLGPRRWWW